MILNGQKSSDFKVNYATVCQCPMGPIPTQMSPFAGKRKELRRAVLRLNSPNPPWVHRRRMNQPQKPASNSKTILLAEDDENDVFLIRRALQKAGLGHALVHVPNGQEAIDYLVGNAPYNDRLKH